MNWPLFIASALLVLVVDSFGDLLPNWLYIPFVAVAALGLVVSFFQEDLDDEA